MIYSIRLDFLIYHRAGIVFAFMIDVMEKITARTQEMQKETHMRCNVCGIEIFPREIYYALCVHMEMQKALSENVRIFEIKPLEFQCRFCAERGVSTC
ncbi:MAG: hypothetical protein ABIB41_12335 [Nitrospirota bacterium]